MSNPPYGGVELPFLKGDLEGFLYEVMRDTIKGKNLPHFAFLFFKGLPRLRLAMTKKGACNGNIDQEPGMMVEH